MIVRTIWVQYQQRYEGEYMPNIVDAWDEYSLDENWDGYDESLAKHRAMIGDNLGDFADVKELVIDIPDEAVLSLFAKPPTVSVKVVVNPDE